jgi:hypothetical protein
MFWEEEGGQEKKRAARHVLGRALHPDTVVMTIRMMDHLRV